MIRPAARRKIGENLRRARCDLVHPLGQAEIAALLGVTKSYVSRIERGKASLRVEDLVILLETTELEHYALLSGCPIGF